MRPRPAPPPPPNIRDILDAHGLRYGQGGRPFAGSPEVPAAPRELQVWRNGTDTVIALDLEDVRAVLVDHRGFEEIRDTWQPGDWAAAPPDEPITIQNAHEWLSIHRTALQIPRNARIAVTATAAEWAASQGRGLLCSTER